MPACTVTSRAVVGSSATSTSGLAATAIAIITRCRSPPESWWGYCRSRSRGLAMPTRSSSSAARVCAARRSMPSCSFSTSQIWRPTVNTGLSEVIGSWKT